MSSPGSRARRNPAAVIKRALIGRCASTCKGRQAGGGDLGLEIVLGAGVPISDVAERLAVKSRAEPAVNLPLYKPLVRRQRCCRPRFPLLENCTTHRLRL